MIRLNGRHMISLQDYTREELTQLIDLGLELKRKVYTGQPHPILAGKTLGMIFQKPSLRTMVSFQVGMHQLGGYAVYLGPDQISLGKREITEDIARVLSSYCDGIMARVFDHKDILDLAKYSRVPVINGLSDFNHPSQVLADLFTIVEAKGKTDGLTLAYIGDGNNMAHSLLYGCSKMGMNVHIASPSGYTPNEDVVAQAKENQKRYGTHITITNDPVEAIKGVDVVYTDVWASMGQEAEKQERLKIFKDFQITEELFGKAHDDAILLHCLPAHYGEEITYEAARVPGSRVFQEAENRMHAEKALLASLMA